MSSQLLSEVFTTWAHLNGILFDGIRLEHVGQSKGFGFLTTESDSLIREMPFCPVSVIRVPTDLMLCAESVNGYAKVDQNFKQLLAKTRPRTTRDIVMMYLFAHLAQSRRAGGLTPTPWTEYIRMLPRSVGIPTMWTEAERALLYGTSLELNIAEKLSTLAKEFDHVRQQSATLPFWNNILWQKNELNLDDWVLVDAWFRSRSMRIQEVGDAMVPAIDMVNHSDQPAAYYDQALINEIELILHSEAIDWPPGVEITISYGDHKPPSEMLFNYGFIDPKTTFDSMALRLYPFADDPLGKAKLHTSPSPPFFVIGQVKANPDELLVSQVEWLSPWIYLVCLNEEDGLGFRILEDVQGRQQLRVLWQEEDITEDVDQLEVFANRHPLCDVFKLRAATVVQQKILSQLARLNRGPPEQQPRTTSQAAGSPEPERVAAAEQLRAIERRLMEGALITLDEEREALLQKESVVAYLNAARAPATAAAAAPQAAPPVPAAPGEEQEEQEDDFS